jgi:hypothetical protein
VSIKERVSVDFVCSFEMLSVPYQLAKENMEAGGHLFEDVHVVFPQDTGHYKYARIFWDWESKCHRTFVYHRHYRV